MGLHVLVLAGGSGTRLWPLSRASLPKHLLPLAPGGATLLAATLERVRDLGDAVHVVTTQPQAAACREALAAAGADPAAVIAEPVARGTGPALGLAVATIARDDPGALIASVHADHRVADPAAYRAAVLASAGWARATAGLATVGLLPSWAATGFGYVELDGPPPAPWSPPRAGVPAPLDAAARALPAYTAAGFTEKPDAETAAAFVAGGRHLWNLGLFAWPAGVFLEEMHRAAPEAAAGVDRVVALRAGGDDGAAAEAYASLQTAAVEPMVLERGARLTIVRASFGWSDLGSWADLHAARLESGEADAHGNVVEGDAILADSTGCTVEARGGRLVAVLGAAGLVVVDTPDSLLVVPQERSQQVKELVDRLREEGRAGLL